VLQFGKICPDRVRPPQPVSVLPRGIKQGFPDHRDGRQFPRQVIGVLNARVEALTTSGRMKVFRIAHQEDSGSVEKGKLAGLVLRSADPLQNISNTQKMNAVIVNGRVLDHKALDSLLASAENDLKSK
jgi:hypothetical protein